MEEKIKFGDVVKEKMKNIIQIARKFLIIRTEYS